MPDLNENSQVKPAPLDPSDPLDAIAIEAMGGEQKADAAQAAILDPEPAIDPAQVWAQVPKMLGGILTMALPELAGVYTDDKCLAWGHGMAAVADKYGWDAGETMGRFGPEIALTVATLPLALPTFAAIKARRAEKPQKQPEKVIDPEEAEKAAEANANPMMQPPGNFSEPH